MADRATRARRAGWVALAAGAGAWALVKFDVFAGVDHPLVPVLKALSTGVAILGLVVCAAALVVVAKSRRPPGATEESGAVGEPGAVGPGNAVSGQVGGSVLQANTINGPVTMSTPLPLWIRLAVAFVVVAVLAVGVLSVVVLTASEEDPDLRAVTTVSFGHCAGGWVVPTPPGQLPIEDRPEGAVQADQGEVLVTLQGSLPAAVVLQSMRAEVVSRKPAATGVRLETPCEADVIPRSFGVDLTRDNSVAFGIPGADGGEKVPAPRFPFQVNESEVEQFVIKPNVSTDEVEWRLRITWTSGTRRGETVVDDNGRPFRTTGTTAVSANYCADLRIPAWTPPGEYCPPLKTPTQAGFTGAWTGSGTLTFTDDGTAVWATGGGEARIRLLSVDGHDRATADVVASTTPDIDVGDRLRLNLAYDKASVRGLTQLGAEMLWCRPGAPCQ
ncbi:hypothetical protein [Actinokineospora globicatena]|uniref:hypothetical protein n=1 Tax=Actinokineospora globicatena TaxID=103729 RepID=UPI0020A47191|nr:hypothetical protein [Actinokineospora globicatena]MCP2303004.1 hypothetical protein [Actinokineospora globicatena]GLW79888.1 hypothetical protein Aglo01_43690 [Actinokineospora globicatena]GLW85702.1 hypothetical protein Aglo02_33420 [Actinokineospora globicatena]